MQHSSVIIHTGSLAPYFSVLQVCFQVGVHKCSIYSGGKGRVYVHLLLLIPGTTVFYSITIFCTSHLGLHQCVQYQYAHYKCLQIWS